VIITVSYTVAIFAGVGLMALQDVGVGVNIAIGLLTAVFIFAVGGIASYLMRAYPDQTVKEWFGIWSLAGTRNLRRTFQV
jgi:MFS-type transporter involved in bile tolerance (Atg22 family)